MNLEDGSRSYEHGCRDKRRFRSRTEAKKAAKKQRTYHGKLLYPYPCAHCFSPADGSGWHLTSTPPARLRSDDIRA